MPLSSDRHIIDEKFHAALSDLSVKPSGRVWMRIAHSLNLQKQSSAKRIFFIAGLLMLIGSSAGVFETIHHSRSSSSKHIEKAGAKKQLASLRAGENNFKVGEVAFPVWEKAEKGLSNSFFISKNSSVFPEESNRNPVNESISFPISSGNNEFIGSLPFHFLNTLEEFTPAKKIQHLSSRTDKMIGLRVKTYYLGLTGSFNNTWFFDRAAIVNDNLEYQATFGGSYGLQGGYIFSKHWGMQSAWILNSWEGQRFKNLDLYGRTTSLDYNQQNIVLTYMQLPVLIQYKIPMFSQILNTPVVCNLTLGGQYGRLISYRIDDEKSEVQNNHLFRKSEFAAVAGFDYDFMINRPVFYSLGMRASYGTTIFKSDAPNYFQFDAPHNLVIGVHGAVNFSFSK